MDTPLHYIYLLREREFIRTNEPVYKIGKTKQPQLKRFKNYPAGSELITQQMCRDCDAMEAVLLTQFRNDFTQCLQYGREYFHGDCAAMQRLIVRAVEAEDVPEAAVEMVAEPVVDTVEESDADCESTITASDCGDGDSDAESVAEPIVQITTYEQFREQLGIEIIVTDKITKVGYWRSPEHNVEWHPLYHRNCADFDCINMEDFDELLAVHLVEDYKYIKREATCGNKLYSKFLEFTWQEFAANYDKHRAELVAISIANCNARYNAQASDDTIAYIERKYETYAQVCARVDFVKLIKDICSKCYVKRVVERKFQYHEHRLHVGDDHTKRSIFDGLTCTFRPLREYEIDGQIITGSNLTYFRPSLDINIVTEVMGTLIRSNSHIELYRKFCYHVLVAPSRTTRVFYDYYHTEFGVLSHYLTDMLLALRCPFTTSGDYEADKAAHHRRFKTALPRLVVIYGDGTAATAKKVDNFIRRGVRHILVREERHVADDVYYTIPQHRVWLEANRERIGDRCPFLDDIFSRDRMLKTNFLMWCCTPAADDAE